MFYKMDWIGLSLHGLHMDSGIKLQPLRGTADCAIEISDFQQYDFFPHCKCRLLGAVKWVC